MVTYDGYVFNQINGDKKFYAYQVPQNYEWHIFDKENSFLAIYNKQISVAEIKIPDDAKLTKVNYNISTLYNPSKKITYYKTNSLLNFINHLKLEDFYTQEKLYYLSIYDKNNLNLLINNDRIYMSYLIKTTKSFMKLDDWIYLCKNKNTFEICMKNIDKITFEQLMTLSDEEILKIISINYEKIPNDFMNNNVFKKIILNIPYFKMLNLDKQNNPQKYLITELDFVSMIGYMFHKPYANYDFQLKTKLNEILTGQINKIIGFDMEEFWKILLNNIYIKKYFTEHLFINNKIYENFDKYSHILEKIDISINYKITYKPSIFKNNMPSHLQKLLLLKNIKLLKFVKNQNKNIIKEIVKIHCKNMFFINNFNDELFMYCYDLYPKYIEKYFKNGKHIKYKHFDSTNFKELCIKYFSKNNMNTEIDYNKLIFELVKKDVKNKHYDSFKNLIKEKNIEVLNKLLKNDEKSIIIFNMYAPIEIATEILKISQISQKQNEYILQSLLNKNLSYEQIIEIIKSIPDMCIYFIQKFIKKISNLTKENIQELLEIKPQLLKYIDEQNQTEQIIITALEKDINNKEYIKYFTKNIFNFVKTHNIDLQID